MQQFFVEDSQVSENAITITGPDVHHIKNVLRMKPGEKIRVSTASGQDYYCEIAMLGDGFVQAEILDEEVPRTELSSDLYLFQALPKGDRMEYVIQKAVELGVYEIIPVAMKRCVVKLDEKKIEKRRTRWQTIAESAAQQAKRSFVPHVHRLMTFEEALAYAGEHCDIRLAPYEDAQGMQATVDALQTLKPGRSVGILIGPEGGFAPEEIEAAEENWKVLSLGRRILRTDTAAVCALSAVMLALEEREENR